MLRVTAEQLQIQALTNAKQFATRSHLQFDQLRCCDCHGPQPSPGKRACKAEHNTWASGSEPGASHHLSAIARRSFSSSFLPPAMTADEFPVLPEGQADTSCLSGCRDVWESDVPASAENSGCCVTFPAR